MSVGWNYEPQATRYQMHEDQWHRECVGGEAYVRCQTATLPWNPVRVMVFLAGILIGSSAVMIAGPRGWYPRN